MRPAQFGKPWAGILIALAVVVVFSLLLGFFLPGLGQHRVSYADARLMAQFNAMNAALELFAHEVDTYPPSDANDPVGRPYCGSMKLTEALMGRDLFGFHVESIFRQDGLGPGGTLLYPADMAELPLPLRKIRKGPFLQAENANAWRLVDIYGTGNTGPFAESTFVLCDPYTRERPSGARTGMPILYYRANPSGTAPDVMNPVNPQNTYRYQDNQALLALGVPGKPGETHPLADPKQFYTSTQDRKISSKPDPHRRDTFILISAGSDGLYGTADDICYSDRGYHRR